MIDGFLNILRLDSDVLRRRAYFYYMLDGKRELSGYFSSFNYADRVAKLEEMFAKYIGTDHAILTGSGGSSLELVLGGMGVRRSQKLILQAYTCNILKRIIEEYAVPVFVDVDLDSYNADLGEIRKKIVENSVILSVNTYGNPVQIDELLDIATERGSVVIEDCAHSLGSKYKGRKTGSFGEAAIFSLRKNLSVGVGGFVTTNNEKLAEKIRAEQAKFDRGRVMARDVFGVGALFMKCISKNRPSRLFFLYNLYARSRQECNKMIPSLLGVNIAIEQLKRLDSDIARVRKNAKWLTKKLRNNDNLILPSVSEDSFHIYTRYPIRFRRLEGCTVDEICRKLFVSGFEAGMCYHDNFLMNVGNCVKSYPNSRWVSSNMVPVGLSSSLKKEDIELLASIFEDYAD